VSIKLLSEVRSDNHQLLLEGGWSLTTLCEDNKSQLVVPIREWLGHESFAIPPKNVVSCTAEARSVLLTAILELRTGIPLFDFGLVTIMHMNSRLMAGKFSDAWRVLESKRC